MPRFDELIGALYRLKAAHLEVTAGSPITVSVNGVRHAVSSQPTAPAEVDRLLQEITPEQQEQLIKKAGGYQFTYTAPSGAARVTVRQSDGSPRLLIRPLATRDASAAGAAPDQAARPPQPDEPSKVPETDAGAAAEMEALFRKMVEEGCSDLHLSTGAQPFFRKNGVIVAAGDGPPLSADEACALLYSITPPHKREDFERDNDVDFAHEIADLGRFRCNLFRDRRGTCGVFRFIPSEIMTVEDLRLPAAIVDLCKLPKAGVGHRPDRLRQVDHAGGAGRPYQQNAQRPRGDDRRSDRVRPSQQELSDQPARGGRSHAELQDRAARGPARRPGCRARR